jgi:methyltransferase OMS1
VNLKTTQPDPRYSEPSRVPPWVLTFLGIGALGISTYCGFLYTSYQRSVSEGKTLDVPLDVSARYNDTASQFDADVELSEKVLRLGRKRQDLIAQARGDVLEVSCGTGRNIEYYEFGERRGVDEVDGRACLRGCRSVTFTDLSPQMVEITRRKFEELQRQKRPSGSSSGAVAFFRAQHAGEVVGGVRGATATREGGKGAYYDTVVQTMGLCSMPDPVGTLRHLGSITEPEKGRILLLEHGRSYYDWLNRILDNLAPTHANRHGCWWNRDIGAIVRESGLEIVEEKRWHLGTTWRYVLKPKRLG